ncbi:MAG: metallophosphoesterase [Bacteroidales bacterium]|nr:metallophosphoesterase [Bacteroidales bacterium]
MKRFILIMAMAAVAVSASAQRLVILHVNDTHSHFEPVRSGEEEGLGGVIERAAFIDEVRKEEGADNVLLLHAGDFNQGTSYYTVLKGELEVKTVNAMGYDCITLGNHEFDNGIEDLTARLAKIQCPVVCANYDFSSFEAGKYIKPYAIINRGGFKIGIFGMLTDILKVVDRNISDRLPKHEDVETANKWAKYLKEEEHCDLVIMLSHLGFSDEAFTDQELVSRSRNIDLVVGGHSHTAMDEIQYRPDADGKMVPIVQDYCWGESVGRLVVTK